MHREFGESLNIFEGERVVDVHASSVNPGFRIWVSKHVGWAVVLKVGDSRNSSGNARVQFEISTESGQVKTIRRSPIVMVKAQRPTPLSSLAYFLEVFTLEDHANFVEVGERLTCDEVEALAAVFAANTRLRTAQLWISAHLTDCQADSPSDRHRVVYDARAIGEFGRFN